MSQTKAQRRKQQKKKAKERRHKKQTNIAKNQTPAKYRLDVFYKERWECGFREFRHWYQVEAHQRKTEDQRRKGTEIIPARVVDLSTGKIVMEIQGSKTTAPSGAKAEMPEVKSPADVKKGFLGFKNIFGKK